MADILVTEAPGSFDVTLTDGASVTKHEVRVSAEDLAHLGLTDCDPRALVEESFRFLLEREPKETILASFELARIEDFFPEYPGQIRARMRGGS